MMRGQHTIQLFLILLFSLILHSKQHPLPILVNNVQSTYRQEEHASPLSFCKDVEAESPSSCADTILRGMESYNRDPPVDVVYVIHYEPYSKRRETLAKTLREMGLLERTFWISSPDPPELGGDEYDHMRFVREDANDPIHHAFFGRPLSEREISVSMKHYGAWKRLADSRHRRALILEDDAKLHPHFHTRLWDYVDELKDTNWSVLCLGGAGFGTGFMGACETIPECEARSKHVYRKYWNRSETSEIFDLNVMRYADSYVVFEREAREF